MGYQHSVGYHQKRAAAAALLRENPRRSNAEVAKLSKASRPTVRAIRAELGIPPSGNQGGGVKRPARLEQISEMTAKGFHREQIAETLGITPDHVSKLAHTAGIEIISRVGVRNKDVKVISQTMLELDAITTSMRVLNTGVDGVTTEQAKEWVLTLTEAMSAFTQLRRKLRLIAYPLTTETTDEQR